MIREHHSNMEVTKQKTLTEKIKSPAAESDTIQYKIERDPHHRASARLNSNIVGKLNEMC